MIIEGSGYVGFVNMACLILISIFSTHSLPYKVNMNTSIQCNIQGMNTSIQGNFQGKCEYYRFSNKV